MRKLAATLLLLLGSVASAQEQAGPEKLQAETSRDYLRFAFNFYKQSDGGGNPNLKEDMTVLEPQLLLGVGLSEKLSMTVKGQADIISAASVDKRYRFAPGTQSGASGDKYFGLEAGLFYSWSDEWKVGGGASIGTEYDYRSIGANVRVVHERPDRNDTFVLKLSAYFDTLDIIKFDGSEDGSDNRTSYSVGLGWTHVIGPRTVMTLNNDLTIQDGYLATPYNSVVVAGVEVDEVLPDSRIRNATFGRVRHLLLDDLAVEPGLGFYLDDWGAMAVNFEARAYWECVPGRLILQPWYRFHWQTEVDQFVDENDATIPDERTQDSDLADFTSHTFGLKLVAPHVNIFGADTELEIGADYSLRSDSLNSFSVTVGFMVRF